MLSEIILAYVKEIIQIQWQSLSKYWKVTFRKDPKIVEHSFWQSRAVKTVASGDSDLDEI